MEKLTLYGSITGEKGFINFIESKLSEKKLYDINTIKNVLLKDRNDSTKKPSYYLTELYKSEIGYDDNLYNKTVQEDFKELIERSISSYTMSKNKITDLYSDYVDFLREEHGIRIYPIIPDKLPSSPFEKKIAIIKLLHNQKLTVSEIASEFHTNPKSIRPYLEDMVSDEQEKGFIVNGEKIKIEFDHETSTYAKNDSYSMDETSHPLLLTPNLRQVTELLEGLYIMNQGKSNKFAYNLASNIWNQLSDYAKGRILNLSDQSSELHKNWYEELDESTQVILYKKEDDLINLDELDKEWLHFLKNKKKLNIYCEDDENPTFYNCKVRDYDDYTVTILVNDSEIILNKEKILKVSLNS